MGKNWEELYRLVLKHEPSVIEIPAREEMFSANISREHGHQFIRCVEKVQSVVGKITFWVGNSDDSEKLGQLIQNYSLYQRRVWVEVWGGDMMLEEHKRVFWDKIHP